MARPKAEPIKMTGNRLNIGISAYNKTQLEMLELQSWREIVGINDDRTIRRWLTDGIPKKQIPRVAAFFNIDEECLKNPLISDENFRQIVLLRKGDPKCEIRHLIPSAENFALEQSILTYYNYIKNKLEIEFQKEPYIPLNIIENYKQNSTNISESSGKTQSNLRQSSDQDIFEIINMHESFILIGESGAGKTFSLKKYLIERISTYKAGDEVCIYLSLPQYSVDDNFLDIISYISGLSNNDVLLLLRTQRLFLMLDSLDECNDQDAWTKKIQLVVNNWSNTKIVLATEPQLWKKNINLKEFVIQSLNKEQQVSLLAYYLKTEESAYAYIKQLHSHPTGEFILKSPLMLSMVAKSTSQEIGHRNLHAQIYRLYLKCWYNNESNKISKICKTNFSESILLDHLSEVATKIKIQSLKNPVSDLNLIEIIGDRLAYTIKILKTFSRIPICYLGNNNFIYFHEDFQKFLIATYMLNHPAEFKRSFEYINLKSDIRGFYTHAWRTIIVYAYEMDNKPSLDFIKTAWQVDPLTVAIMDDNAKILKSFPYSETNDFINYCLKILLYNENPLSDQVHDSVFESDSCDFLKWSYRISEYLACFDEPVFNDSNNRIHILQSNLIKIASLKLTMSLYNSGIISKDQISKNKIQYWIKDATLNDAILLLKNNFAQPDDFFKKIPQWIEDAIEIDDAIQLIEYEFAYHTDFSKKIPQWIEDADPYEANRLIENNFVWSLDDFPEKRDQLIKEAKNAEDAMDLIRYGIAIWENFFDKIPQWIKEAPMNESTVNFAESLAECKQFKDYDSVAKNHFFMMSFYSRW